MPNSTIIFIGYQTESERATAASHLLALGFDDLAVRVARGIGVEEFDMTIWPSKGDALDHIGPDISLVVAFNLYGIGLRDRPDPYAPRSPFFYNHRNHEILPLCQRHRVPLLCIGEQPQGMVGVRFYEGFYAVE